METHNAYESPCMQEIMGETLRPGGFSLTDAGVQYCRITSGDTVLDLGCGRGATVNYLRTKYHLTAVGIDPSAKLIEAAQDNYGYAGFFLGQGEALPFEDASFNCVLAECTLSLTDSPDAVINQVYRVLKENGWFVVSDVYARNPKALINLSPNSVNSCMRGMHDLGQLKKRLEQAGFIIISSEDYSQYLKELMVKIGFSYGSMGEFWNAAAAECGSGDEFHKTIKKCKPGYFLMVAKKPGKDNQ
ncbi:MAG: methyltransferase domain-containing protein [Syntrophomonadaceae bacterium]|nr:methyltransferase domain-containing protein [Syntrophomonadaceae bacterium]